MSFISVQPQPRADLEKYSNRLLAQFDTQLGIIADRYLAFFQERRSIEVAYINSLRKLHRKAKIVDASFDPRAEPTTTRAAWDVVAVNLEREANTQQAFVDTLDNDVIKPLRTLKESEDETRKRIEGYLKESAAKYADHVENKISNLEEYSKKYHPRKYSHSSEVSPRPQDGPNKRFGDKVSTLFRGRREDSREAEPAKSEEAFDDECRSAVRKLNTFRLMRAENLGDGYDCLEELVFTPTIEDVLVKYMDGMITSSARYEDLAMSTRAEVEKAFAGTDTSGLKVSFRRDLSYAIPPSTLYRPSAYSDLVFGVPLVDVETNEDNVPKLMVMCMEEVEKRGLNSNKIYSVGSKFDAEILQLRRRFEREMSFSFGSTDNIHSVATLLKRYLWDLPEPLFMLSLRDYRNYRQNRVASCTDINFSMLRSKIRELHPVHRASLEALLRHLWLTTSHSDTNAMTVDALTDRFCYAVLLGNEVMEDGIHLKKLVMEDLIQGARALFDESPSLSPHVPSFDVAETASTLTYGSFLSPELPQSAEVQAMGSTTRHRPRFVHDIPMSSQSSSSSLPLGAAMESRLTSSPTPMLSPLLGLLSSRTLTEEIVTATQEPVARGSKAVETPANSIPAENESGSSATVTRWLHQQREAMTIPQSPIESVRSGFSGPLSSATSLRTRM